jgi:GTP-binding protein EngB required for normal cell division
MNKFDEIIKQLPVQLGDQVLEIANQTINANTLLRVCIVGEFSAGKSSLINALLGENLLPTAREETTALPTFVEYAPTLDFELVNVDGTTESIAPESFALYTTNAPANALCSTLYHPSDWLKDLSLIDLPGLGSQSQRHSDYTTAQIAAADAIVYLLSPRGTTQGDLKTLQTIKNYGKHVTICVSHWDTIEASIAEGEQAPDLTKWQNVIFDAVGLNLPLIGVSKYGHGRDFIIDFLQQTKNSLHLIREQRFIAELQPLLINALGSLNAELEVCNAKNGDEKQTLHNELLKQREALLGLKSELYERSNNDQNQLEQKALQITKKYDTALAGELKKVPLAKQEDWQIFTEKTHQLLQNHVALTAQELTALSNDYGQLNLPTVEIEKFNLNLPPPKTITIEDFIDNSRLSLLQSELERKQREALSEEAKINGLPDVSVDEVNKQLQTLRQERTAIASQELPRVLQAIEGSNAGSQLGKTIGQILDIGLIVFEAPLAILKTASMLAEGSKVVKTVTETANAAKTLVSHPEVMPLVNNLVVNNLGFLEKLSLSYWGEQIGKKYDQPAQTIEMIDPQAQAEQKRILFEQDQKIAAQRAELQRLENLQQERAYTGWALEQNQKEQQLLRDSIQASQAKAEAAKKSAELEQIHQQSALLENYRQQLINQSLLHFDQQTRPMLALLRQTCKNYWHDYVEKSLMDNLQHIEALNVQLQQLPEQKQAVLADLQQQISHVQMVLNGIKG